MFAFHVTNSSECSYNEPTKIICRRLKDKPNLEQKVMRKIIALIVVILMACSININSQDKPKKTIKQPDIEKTSEKRAESRISPSGKKTQRKMQKHRIENHNQKKTNNMWKK